MQEVIYQEDILKDGFEYTTIHQNEDYEGKVTTTLVRKRNANETSKAVLYIHGFNDYFFQKAMANEFLKNKYHFYALDLRKYGRSILPHQKINNVRNLKEYYQDIDAALKIIKNENCQQVLLAGHSTGGLIVTLYASDRKDSKLFDAVYCNSPFYDMNLSQYKKNYLIPIVSSVGKKFPNLKVPGSFSEFYGLSLHKSYHGEWDYNLKWKPNRAYPIHTGWLNAINKGHKIIQKGVMIEKPILIMHSEKSVFPSEWSEEMFQGDAILNVNDIIKNAQKIKAPLKSIVGVEGALHDMVLSKKKTRDIVYQILFDWLQKNANF